MRTRELQRYEKLLLKRRAEIFSEIERLSDPVRQQTEKDASGDSPYGVHMAEQGTAQSEREKVFMLSSKAKRYLHHIDEALRRIKDRSYGKCMDCGKQINPERLKALPHARLCIECKEKEEVIKKH